MKMTPGKLAGMKAVSNDRGVIAAAAMDQRGSLKKALAKEKGSDVGDREMEEFKIARHRGADEARERDPARPGMGTAGRQTAREGRRACCWRTKRPATTPTKPGRLPDLLDVWSRAPAQGGRRGLPQDPPLLHAVRPEADQRAEARLGRADRRRVPRQRHPVLPRVRRLRGRGRRERPGVREEEARDRHRRHGRSSPRTATAST